MIATPRLLYILQHSPCRVQDSWFAKIDAQVLSLIWAGGQPRISLGVLQHLKFEGGIALPNIRKYYEASQVSIVNEWAYAEQNDPAFRMDRWGMGKHSYLHALYGGKLPAIARPATQTVVQIRKRLLREMKWDKRLIPLPPGLLCGKGIK